MKTIGTAQKIAGGSASVLLGMTLATGGAAAVMLTTALAPTQTGLVQTAEAQTSQTAQAKKAKKAYQKFLANGSYQWTQFQGNAGHQKASTYSFALGDINGDKVPELFVTNNNTYYAAGYSRVYTYYKGKVKLAGKLSVPPKKIYTKGHVLYFKDQHTGGYWGTYFKLKNGKLQAKAGWTATDYPNGKYHYTGFTVNGKKVSHAAYKKYVAKLTKNSKKTTGFTYHKNTAANRAAYLG